jgi:phenylpyruvate tautomerase PptA (4-oxalocrotonate tautomerase family)
MPSYSADSQRIQSQEQSGTINEISRLTSVAAIDVYIQPSDPFGCFTMPMIDVYAPADLFPAGTDGRLGHELTMAVLRAEGVATPGPFHLNNTAAFIHRMDPHTVHTAATDSARTVRVQIITPPAALTREGQKQLVKEATDIVTKISGDPTQASRTWVILTEAAEGGWGLSGTAFGRQEFVALAAKAAAARAK